MHIINIILYYQQMNPYMTAQNAGSFTAFAQMLGAGGGMIGGHSPYAGLLPPMAAYTPVRSPPRSDKIEVMHAWICFHFVVGENVLTKYNIRHQ